MPGPLLQQGATVLCPHGGQAQPATPNARVTASGATAVITGPWIVTGCPGIAAAGIPPCATAQWLTGTTRVTSGGQPLVVMSGQSLTQPNGVPLIPQASQTRVTAT